MAQDNDVTRESLANSEPPFEVIYDGDRLERINDQGYYGFMYAAEYEWDDRKVISEAYSGFSHTGGHSRRNEIDGQLRRSLYAFTTWLDVDDAVECLREIPKYNRFRSDSVILALRDLDVDVRVVVGREGSPVIYLWTYRPRSVMLRLKGITGDMETAGRGPDELGAILNPDHYPVRTVGKPIEVVDSSGPALIRAWWD